MKNKYQEALVVYLSGLTTKKNENEIWWKNGCGDKVTYEGIGHGKYIKRSYYSCGAKEREEEYQNGYLHGWLRVWYENGYLAREEVWKNGKKNGPSKHYRLNGILLYNDEIKDDEPHGMQKDYDELGNLENVWEYNQGKLIRKVK